jgi:hypothetical protein
MAVADAPISSGPLEESFPTFGWSNCVLQMFQAIFKSSEFIHHFCREKVDVWETRSKDDGGFNGGTPVAGLFHGESINDDWRHPYFRPTYGQAPDFFRTPKKKKHGLTPVPKNSRLSTLISYSLNRTSTVQYPRCTK